MLTEIAKAELAENSVLSLIEIDALLAVASESTYRRGERIIEKNADDRDLYLILDGRVRAFSTSVDGRELTLGYQSNGAFFGEMALLSGHARSASVEAAARTQLAKIGVAAYEVAALAQPTIRLKLMNSLIHRVGELTDRVESQAFLNVYGRIRALLLRDAKPADDHHSSPKMTQQSIANHVGASREMVSKVMTQLRQGGYIEVGPDAIKICKSLPAGW